MICFPVLLYNPVSVQFGHRIRRIGVKRCLLILRHLFHFSVQFAGRGLINPAGISETADSNRLQHPQYAGRIHIRGKLRNVKADLYMALRRQVINLVRPHSRNDLDETHRIRQIAVMQMEVLPSLQVCDSLPEIYRRAAYDPMDLITLLQQKFRQI